MVLELVGPARSHPSMVPGLASSGDWGFKSWDFEGPCLL